MDSKITFLHYLDGDAWRCIPRWAVGMADLGAALHRYKVSETETLIVVHTLPAQNWAAAFLTLGYLLSAHCGNRSGASGELHFQKLRSLENGTPVKLLHNDCHYDAVIHAQCEDSVEILYEQHKNQAQTKYILICTAENCHKVRLIQQGQFKGVRDRGRMVSKNPDFVSTLLQGGDLVDHCLGSRTEFILAGEVVRLRAELETPFRCDNSEGTIQDVLQIDKFTRPTQDFCGAVIAATAKPGEAKATADTGLIVFESATAYLRHNYTMTAPIKVILLDRSERLFAHAASAVSDRFMSRLDKEPEQLSIPVALGTEAFSFLEFRN